MDPESPQNPDDLQFDEAEVAAGSADGLTCNFCHTPVHDVYFEINGQLVCEKCRYEFETERASGSSVGRFTRAVAAGSVAAAVGAGIYYAVLALTGYEVALVAIVVGFLVGFAVRWGARGKGGWVYQGLAMLLTYMAIVSTYVPFIIEEIRQQEMASETEEIQPGEREPSARPEEGVVETTDEAAPLSAETVEEEPITFGAWLVAVFLLILFVMAIPFLAGFENILGIVIIGIGLYEAWKINKSQPLVVEGPFKVGPGPSFSTESTET